MSEPIREEVNVFAAFISVRFVVNISRVKEQKITLAPNWLISETNRRHNFFIKVDIVWLIPGLYIKEFGSQSHLKKYYNMVQKIFFDIKKTLKSEIFFKKCHFRKKIVFLENCLKNTIFHFQKVKFFPKMT